MTSQLNSLEKRAIGALASILSLRMLGLFMILPVLAVYVNTELLASPFVIGLALGIYGLTQAIFQVPFGMLSDRFGRKPLIITGLLIFLIGSVIAALAESSLTLIIGRALQGAGAISSVVLATAADLTRDSQRTKAIAILGMVVGACFCLALIVGPLVAGLVGIRGVFWAIAAMAMLASLIAYRGLPAAPETGGAAQTASQTGIVRGSLKSVLREGSLLRLDIGIFCLHAVLMAMFVVVPLILHEQLGMPIFQHAYLYLVVLILSFAVVFPLLLWSERRGRVAWLLMGAVTLLGIVQWSLWGFHSTLTQLVINLFLFFIAFNVLEALLPSLISRIAPAAHKGTALGVYSTAQFLGAFVGGIVGGWCYAQQGAAGVFLFCGMMMLLWLLVMLKGVQSEKGQTQETQIESG